MAKDYSKGKIYKISSLYTDKVYIGSTIRTLEERFVEHKHDFKSYLKNNRNYCSSYEIMKTNNASIELVELYTCSCELELQRREGYYQLKTENCINKNIAGRTHKEYREHNREQITEYMKEYREKNKEEILEQRKLYREEHKEKIKKYSEEHKEESKKYREQNQKKKADYDKRYQEQNKEKIKEQKRLAYLRRKEKTKSV